jgi:hypothetical protein
VAELGHAAIAIDDGPQHGQHSVKAEPVAPGNVVDGLLTGGRKLQHKGFKRGEEAWRNGQRREAIKTWVAKLCQCSDARMITHWPSQTGRNCNGLYSADPIHHLGQWSCLLPFEALIFKLRRAGLIEKSLPLNM